MKMTPPRYSKAGICCPLSLAFPQALAIASRDPDAHDLHQERLIRDIMAVDELPYTLAQKVMIEIFIANRDRSAIGIFHVPLEGGLLLWSTLALVAWPLVFYLPVSQPFADSMLATYDELPEPASLFNTGSWTWTWMEPIIGTASFSILCLQLFRGQMKKLALKP